MEALLRLGLSVALESLPVADYLVAERIGVERKTVGDLHRSIETVDCGGRRPVSGLTLIAHTSW